MHGLIKLSEAQNLHFFGVVDAWENFKVEEKGCNGWMQICVCTSYNYLQILVFLLLVKTFSVIRLAS